MLFTVINLFSRPFSKQTKGVQVWVLCQTTFRYAYPQKNTMLEKPGQRNALQTSKKAEEV